MSKNGLGEIIKYVKKPWLAVFAVNFTAEMGATIKGVPTSIVLWMFFSFTCSLLIYLVYLDVAKRYF